MKNNPIFVDVGYTNIKVLINDEVLIKPVKNSISWLKQLSQSYFCYVACNNVNYLKKIKKIKNIYLVKNNDFVNDVKINDELKINELGIDILAMCYWLTKKKINDAIIISSGTCLTTIVIKNNVLESVQILSGFELEKMSIQKLLKEKKLSFCEQFDYFNLNKSINTAYINKIKGLIKTNQEQFNIVKNVYLTGNYFKNFVINITDILFTDAKIHSDICLESIKLKFSN